MRTQPKLIYITGIVAIVLSIFRWWFIYFDPSQALLGTVIGIGICFVAYILNWMQLKDLKINSMDSRFDSLIISLKDRDLIKNKDLIVI